MQCVYNNMLFSANCLIPFHLHHLPIISESMNLFKYVLKLKFLTYFSYFFVYWQKNLFYSRDRVADMYTSKWTKKGFSRNKHHTIDLKIQFKFIQKKMFILWSVLMERTVDKSHQWEMFLIKLLKHRDQYKLSYTHVIH